MHFLALICSLLFIAASDAVNVFGIDDLARDVTRVESIRQIKNTQRQVSQLAQFGQWGQASQLFSSDAKLIWGDTIIQGRASIESWLRNDAGDMNGVQPGSLDTLIAENPVVTLSINGMSAKGRWNGIRFQGDGKGRTRVQGGIYENEYAMTDKGWQISLLHYYAMYEGTHKEGWRNLGGKGIPIIPYHFTAEGSGVPIPPTEGPPRKYNGTMEQLSARIQKLNDEDAVRNLMHAHGYYVDRRMWTDVTDLHTDNTTVQVGDGGTYFGKDGVRTVLERMGPEELSQGVNNDHPIFDMIVEVQPDGEGAITRGIEIGMVGDANTRAAQWRFNVFRNRFVKEEGTWKIQDVVITPLVISDYYDGWGHGGVKSLNISMPPFLELNSPVEPTPIARNSSMGDLQRRLRRSAAYDGTENQSHAYGYFLDDLLADKMGALFAKKGHKASPFAGFFQTPERITQANYAAYGSNRSALRSSISFHWRPQPVILVSEDGRSATIRARLLQPSTSINRAGSFNSAIYHDQVVLEDGKWRLWSITIDEFYWQSESWEEGWSMADPKNATRPQPGQPNTEAPAWTKKFPPDITIADVGERESTFRGGSGQVIQWPDIQRMYFQYRNPVSGRRPRWYWPGCVPCQVRQDWSLEANGWQEPATGPSVYDRTR